MYDIVFASGDIQVTAYSPKILMDIPRYIMKSGGHGGHPSENIEKFASLLSSSMWYTDMSDLSNNIRTAQELFPVKCWRPYYSNINWQWYPSISMLLNLHHLYSLSANATDFRTRFCIARDFQSTQSRLQALSNVTIQSSCACYCPLLNYLEEHILQQSPQVTSQARAYCKHWMMP
ncbi:hypothetical protein CPB85DRAFT_1458195 [Mucidula mucida]|nr:hypothetical protein CPB85DRAFT_1458195 [Mucidula mucida]